MNAEEKILSGDSRTLRKTQVIKIPIREMLKKYSTWSLLISNILIALFALAAEQSVLNILWVYWFQSVIIGVFNFFKIIFLKDYSIDGLKMNNKPLTKSKSAKVSVAFFFLIHYGFFHFVYAIFLSAFATSFGSAATYGIDVAFILLTSSIFFVNYLGEFIFAFKREKSIVYSLPKLMMAPYKRIIPMHLTIILSGFVLAGGVILQSSSNTIILLIFLGLKTFMDLITNY